VNRRYYSACSPLDSESGRSHTEAWAGFIVSLTTPTRLPLIPFRAIDVTMFVLPPPTKSIR
jgi:hypothetical protein